MTPEQNHEIALELADTLFGQQHDFHLRPYLDSTIVIGSHSYKTNTPESDYDYLHLVVPRMRHIIGLGEFDGWQEKDNETGLDMNVYSMTKFVRLALAGNPNVIETLFFPEESYLTVGPGLKSLLEHRDVFLSKHVFKKFSAYADGQMKRMESGKAQMYMGHKRKELVQRIGYDPKDASRLIHLLYMGYYIARFGQVRPVLNDVERGIVMDIKAGMWRLQDVKDHAADLAAVNESEFKHCELPDEADYDFGEILLMEIHRKAVA